MIFTKPYILSLLVFLTWFGNTSAQTRSEKNRSQSQENNQSCERCHTRETLIDNGKTIYLSRSKIIDTTLYYESIHGGFSCLDCHAEEYDSFPHAIKVKDESIYSCLDCHEGNKKTADFHFEKISEEYSKSVHAKKQKDMFSCWKCHNPHSYVTSMDISDSIGITAMVKEHNLMCLACHGDKNKLQSAYGREMEEIMQHHDWLPNQKAHFMHVRCLDCHALIPDSVRVSHVIMPSSQAIRNCYECHSKDTRLQNTLYKYHQAVAKNSFGFMNSQILENSYVMGANRNIYLNIISIVVFALVIIGILIHAFLRILKNK